jgi:hypothetical protein
VNARIVDQPSRWAGRRFCQIADLGIGQALFVPWEDLDSYHDGYPIMRNYAWMWGRRLGRKHGTRKGPAGIYVIRRA